MISTALLFLLLLSILVLVHEFGHFIIALKAGAKIEEFALGLPFTKSFISKEIKGVKISLYPILFGGFVKIYGEENKEKEAYAFGNLSRVKRFLIIIAGVTMNYLLAWLILSFLLTQGVPRAAGVYITEVAPESPAHTAGITINQQIIAVNDRRIDYVDEVINITKDSLGKPVKVTLTNNQTVTVIPRISPPAGQGPLGIGLRQEWQEIAYPWYQAPFLGFMETNNTAKKMLLGVGDILGKLIIHREAPKEVAGPLGIASLTGEAAKYGDKAVLDLLAILSLNLAIINILPFPALDGGRLVFVVLEPLIGKKQRELWERRINTIGMTLLLGLMILITVNDILKLLPH